MKKNKYSILRATYKQNYYLHQRQLISGMYNLVLQGTIFHSLPSYGIWIGKESGLFKTIFKRKSYKSYVEMIINIDFDIWLDQFVFLFQSHWLRLLYSYYCWFSCKIKLQLLCDFIGWLADVDLQKVWANVSNPK